MSDKFTLVLAALATLSLGACATTGDEARTANVEDMGDGVMCETVYATGTRLNPQRICTTAEDRAALKADADAVYRNVNDQRSVTPGARTGN